MHKEVFYFSNGSRKVTLGFAQQELLVFRYCFFEVDRPIDADESHLGFSLRQGRVMGQNFAVPGWYATPL